MEERLAVDQLEVALRGLARVVLVRVRVRVRGRGRVRASVGYHGPSRGQASWSACTCEMAVATKCCWSFSLA